MSEMNDDQNYKPEFIFLKHLSAFRIVFVLLLRLLNTSLVNRDLTKVSRRGKEVPATWVPSRMFPWQRNWPVILNERSSAVATAKCLVWIMVAKTWAPQLVTRDSGIHRNNKYANTIIKSSLEPSLHHWTLLTYLGNQWILPGTWRNMPQLG